MASAHKTVPTAQPEGRAALLAMLDTSCPRCCGGFECGVNAGHCDCFGIRLTDRLRAELAERYSGCLCLRCLRELIERDARGEAADAVDAAAGTESP